MSGESWLRRAADDIAWDRDMLVGLLHVMVRRAGGKVEISGPELDAVTWESVTHAVVISGPPASEAWSAPTIATVSIERKPWEPSAW